MRATGIRLPNMRALVNIISTKNLANNIKNFPNNWLLISCSWPKLKASMENKYTLTMMKIAELPAMSPVNKSIKFLNF